MNARRFPLATILELRATAKKRAEDVLAQANMERQAAEQQCIQARAELVLIAEQLGGDRFTAGTQMSGWRALSLQEQSCRELEVRLSEAETKVTNDRTLLVSASRDHELVLKLEGKWLTKRRAAEARTEELALDDFVNARTAARQMAGGTHA